MPRHREHHAGILGIGDLRAIAHQARDTDDAERAREALTTTIITMRPTIASRICVWITTALRAGVPERRGRNASTAPSRRGERQAEHRVEQARGAARSGSGRDRGRASAHRARRRRGATDAHTQRQQGGELPRACHAQHQRPQALARLPSARPFRDLALELVDVAVPPRRCSPRRGTRRATARSLSRSRRRQVHSTSSTVMSSSTLAVQEHGSEVESRPGRPSPSRMKPSCVKSAGLPCVPKKMRTERPKRLPEVLHHVEPRGIGPSPGRSCCSTS